MKFQSQATEKALRSLGETHRFWRTVTASREEWKRTEGLDWFEDDFMASLVTICPASH